MKPFDPEQIFYEPSIVTFPLGKELFYRYKKMGKPMHQIESHNNIEILRTQPNTAFPRLKNYLIIGVRKTHKYNDNEKVSDFLTPYTSSGCSAICLYCYLVCNYNKCSYLRLFVNREEMMEKLIKKARSFDDEKVFEIGSNSDLVLENQITNNLEWTINEFCSQPKGKLTFPTKFHMVDDILPLNHKGRVIARVSLNPDLIIKKTEFKTSSLDDRIEAINKLSEADYPVGILIAPVILIDNWKSHYTELIEKMEGLLSEKAKKTIFFEIIFMTYSFVHNKINSEAFPNAMGIYDPELFTGRGRGKYWYRPALREDGEIFFRQTLGRYFPDNNILYIV